MSNQATAQSSKPEDIEDWPLADVKAWLREHLDDGVACPCCTQFAKVYERSIHSTSARELIRFWRRYGENWGRPIDTAGKNSPDLVKCRYWGLMEKFEGHREDGSSRVGVWRVTRDGVLFIRGAVKVPKKVRLYDGRLLGKAGGLVSIDDCLGKKFRYDELMAGV